MTSSKTSRIIDDIRIIHIDKEYESTYKTPPKKRGKKKQPGKSLGQLRRAREHYHRKKKELAQIE